MSHYGSSKLDPEASWLRVVTWANILLSPILPLLAVVIGTTSVGVVVAKEGNTWRLWELHVIGLLGVVISGVLIYFAGVSL